MQFITRFKEFKSTEEGRCHLKALSYTLCYAIFHFLIVFETDVPFCFGKLKVSKLSALPFRPLSLARLILSVLVFIGHKLATFFRLANAYSALVRVIYYPCSFRIVALLCHSWDFAYSFVVVFEAFHNYQLEKLAAKRARLGYSQPGYHGPRISPPVDLTQDEPSESPPPPYSASMLPSEVYLDGERPVSDFSGVGAGSSPTVNGAQSTIAGSTIAQNTVPQSTSTPANAPASVAPANVTPAIATPETNAPSLISTGNQAVVNPTSPIPAAAHHAALPHSESTHDYHYGSHHGSPLYGSYPMAHGSDPSTTAPHGGSQIAAGSSLSQHSSRRHSSSYARAEAQAPHSTGTSHPGVSSNPKPTLVRTKSRSTRRRRPNSHPQKTVIPEVIKDALYPEA